MTAMTASGAEGSYPVQYDVAYPASQSRLLLFLRLFFFWALILPLALVGYFAALLIWLSWFAIMNDGRYPRMLAEPMQWYFRVSTRANAYLWLLTDRFPLDEDSPVTLDIEVPTRMSRLTTFFRIILVIPHIIVLFFLVIAAFFTTFIAWWIILFTGRYPRGLFNFAVGVHRWAARVSVYSAYMVDEYPPFSLS